MRYRLGVSWLISNMIRSPRPGVCRHGQRRCSLPHLVGPATQLWSGFGGVTTESKKWHTIPNFCGLLLAILVYIYICMYVYIYTYGSYIIPILIYIYIHTYQTPPYLGWFMMVSYRVFFGTVHELWIRGAHLRHPDPCRHAKDPRGGAVATTSALSNWTSHCFGRHGILQWKLF
jgi:hypothetical protein